MARGIERLLACMFCGLSPCECNKPKKEVKPKKEAAPRAKPKAEPRQASDGTSRDDTPPRPRPRPSVKDAMKARAKREPVQNKPATPPPPEPKKRSEKIMSEEDILLHAAIRALAPILHPTHRRQYKAVLDTEPGPKEKAVFWKARRQDGLHDLDGSSSGRGNEQEGSREA